MKTAYPVVGGRILIVAAGLALGACSTFDHDAPPPFGEALLIVDTDLPVPRVVSRLRIDLHGEDGAVFASRDDVRPDPRDWPTSFSVFTDDTTRGRTILVRLRAYLEGRISPNGTEPDPSLSIDRLVRVRLEPGRRGRVRVILRGACAGAPANVAIDNPSSCIDDRSVEPSIEEGRIEDTLARDIPSEIGTYGRQPCDALPASDGASAADRVCVPGGAFILGDRFYRPSDTAIMSARPERIVRISRVFVDRAEVSVARYRAVLARGFKPTLPVKALERDGPPGSKIDDACTFSANPRGREDYALSCIPWVTADAFCRFEGGALPTEAQWEYIALAAERAHKAVYPWGDDPPSCDRAIYARSLFSNECGSKGEGPQIALAAPGDVTSLGIRDLGGGLEEHVADSTAGFSDPCWLSASATDPICTRPITKECVADPASQECRLAGEFTHVTRGGNWTTFPNRMRGISRGSEQASTTSELTGFRCVYPAP